MTATVQDILIARHELERLSREHINLKNGDRLEGRVVEIRSDGKIVLDFGKFQAVVELKTSVEKGDILTVVLSDAGKGKTVKLKLEDIQTPAKNETVTETKKTIEQIETIQARAVKELKQQTQRKEFFDSVEVNEDIGTLFENQQGRVVKAEAHRQPVLVFSFQIPLEPVISSDMAVDIKV